MVLAPEACDRINLVNFRPDLEMEILSIHMIPYMDALGKIRPWIAMRSLVTRKPEMDYLTLVDIPILSIIPDNTFRVHSAGFSIDVSTVI